MATITTLQRLPQTDARAERTLVEALRGRGGALTKADAVALTGLSAAETDGALRSLLKSYRSHLAVTDDGELIYKFDPAMERRDAPTLGERLRQVGALAWRGFTLLFKVWIIGTLVVYVLAFVAMLLAMVLARSGGDDRDDRRGGGGGLDLPWLLWWVMPGWGPPRGYGGGQYGNQRHGLAQRRAEPRKPLYQTAFDFVFGPSVKLDPLASEKAVVSYLRAHEGRITATDLVELTGWSYARSDEEATRLLVDYDGEPEVTEQGTLVYVFPELRRTAGQLSTQGAWRYAWDEPRRVPALTGNTDGANAALAAMNGFNLLAALVIGPAFLARFGVTDPLAGVAVTAFPLAFSSLFFAIPGARAVRRARAQRRLAADATRAALIREIAARRGSAAAPEELAAAAARSTGVDVSLAKRILEELLVELEGDVGTDEAGGMRYGFPRFAEELNAVAEARRLAPAAEGVTGEVVFSSEESEEDARPPGPGPFKPRLIN